MDDKINERANKGCSHDVGSCGSMKLAKSQDLKLLQKASEPVSDDARAEINEQLLLATLEDEIPEYDIKLEHVVFRRKSLCLKDLIRREVLRLSFLSSWKAFFNNRQALLDTLRDIADKAVKVRRDCNISHVVNGSVGVVAGGVAIVGSILFPPLLIGGLVFGGAAALANVGTSITQPILFSKLVREADEKSQCDNDLLKNLEDAYKALILSNLFDIEGRTPTGEGDEGFSLTKLQIGLDGANVLTTGVRSAGVGMAELGPRLAPKITTGLLRGVARGAIGIGIVIDGVTVVISAASLIKGSNTEVSEALRKLADEKQEELETLKRRVKSSGLFESEEKDLDAGESRSVLGRNLMASAL